MQFLKKMFYRKMSEKIIHNINQYINSFKCYIILLQKVEFDRPGERSPE